mmetsp:Transcript_43895/g.115351  ORF Transcript_43895/g.115351 Transcript_43895/m.115351 type:complete len:123 (-) Transcript_43895:160-528(-)|eukprot:CAMPEP_0115840956 /NCGR_PEP_ID=MMETSP0287-20121206/7040_1 /TAXON_ID=412157 /ORGANISM="Chrysochromulina rotalis, Strain UIO044" /LENGTH=122 /DNA_ID=CAMNT_0003294587 /DNA_START=24 /DNA_END=392 /DNA_ORIENTATION=-
MSAFHFDELPQYYSFDAFVALADTSRVLLLGDSSDDQMYLETLSAMALPQLKRTPTLADYYAQLAAEDEAEAMAEKSQPWDDDAVHMDIIKTVSSYKTAQRAGSYDSTMAQFDLELDSVPIS